MPAFRVVCAVTFVRAARDLTSLFVLRRISFVACVLLATVARLDAVRVVLVTLGCDLDVAGRSDAVARDADTFALFRDVTVRSVAPRPVSCADARALFCVRPLATARCVLLVLVALGTSRLGAGRAHAYVAQNAQTMPINNRPRFFINNLSLPI